MKISINQFEFSALYGLPHSVVALYLMAIRPRMNYRTGMVGVRPLISWHALTEWVYVEPTAGVRVAQVSIESARRAARRLQAAGLVRIASSVANRQLIFECILADRDKTVLHQADRSATDQADRSKPAPVLGKHAQADRSKNARPTNIRNTGKPLLISPPPQHPKTSGARGGGDRKKATSKPAHGLIWPAQLSKDEIGFAGKQLAGLADPQALLDELAGALTWNGRRVREPLRYFAKLVQLHRAGTFVPELAHHVREQRELAAASRRAVEAAQADNGNGAPHGPLSPAQIEKLPAAIRRRLARNRAPDPV